MQFLAEFRKKYKAKDIIKQIKSLRKLRVLVIGDTIIDQYHYCSSIGKPPKENMIVARYLSEESFAGGVLAVANHIAGFCEDVTLITCLGQQETHERFIKSHLKPNIKYKFFYREDTRTPVKRRFVEPVSLTKMFGISFLDDYDLPLEVAWSVYNYLQDIGDFDVVVVADFGHGFIGNGVARALEKAEFLAVNAQTNTDNAGFNLITKYTGADFLCLDEPEIRLACQSKHQKLDVLVGDMAERLSCPKMIVTHGQYDTVIYPTDGLTSIPVFSTDVRDTVGAGDALFSIASLCAKADFPMDLVGFIGNAVGALKVKTVCNRSSVEPQELFKFIEVLLK